MASSSQPASVAFHVSADDVTTVGADHYLTGTRIQRVIRDEALGGAAPTAGTWPAPSKNAGIAWLVRDQYLRSITPVAIGERIGVLITLEDFGVSAVRVCFRAIRASGAAVACGFATIACLSPGGDEVPLPFAVCEYRRAHAETSDARNTSSFATRAMAGGPSIAALFPDDVLARGARIAIGAADATPAEAGPVPPKSPTRSPASAALRSSVIFRATAILRPSTALTTRTGATAEISRSSIAAPPGAGAVGAPPRYSGLVGFVPEFVGPVVPERGVAFLFPDGDAYNGALLRELYAALPYLAVHFDQADGVARRQLRSGFFYLVDADSLAEHDEYLRRCPDLAELGVFLTGVLFAEALQERGVRPDVLLGQGTGEIAALAVAGAFDIDTGLQIVAHRALARKGAPLGSSGRPAVAEQTVHQFERALSRLAFRAPREQVYSAVEGGLFTGDVPVPRALAAHLAREEDFAAGVRALRRAGCEYFVECGSGPLTRRVSEILSDREPQPASTASDRSTLAAKLAAASSMLARRAAPSNGDDVPRPPDETSSKSSPRARARASAARACPVAITGVGCVLPGALDPESYWRNVLGGVSGISDQEAFTTEAWDSATPAGRPQVIASGSLGELEYDPRLPFTRAEFELLTRTQRLVALAARQCMSRLPARTGAAKPRRERWILGASAEGMREFEELALLEGLRHMVARLDEPESLRHSLARQLDEVAWPPLVATDVNSVGPSATLRGVVERFIGKGAGAAGIPADVVLVDAACASSLYAVDLGIESLRSEDSDLVIVGGVFAPGAGWHPLYALFEGLLGSGSFPFDRRADGVVFGEGAALLALQRLPDAFASGARIHAVIRGVGLSSDGTKASVSEPRAHGQMLAMRRAYENAGVEPRTVQLVEGHGVSNPGFDATELEALRSTFGGVDSTLSPRPLESVKSLIGHTVWAAGAASVVKICRALEEHVVPPQQMENGATNPDAQLEGSGFQIPVSARSWPPNADGEPRRSGVSAFGLGGTNAHVVVEAFSPAYHERLAAHVRTEASRGSMAVVGIAPMFAGSDQSVLMEVPAAVVADGGSARRLGRAALRAALPAELRPDVVDQLDVSQLASVTGAQRVLGRLADWRDGRDRIGVVAGMLGRTARALAASERVYRDELLRLLTTAHADLGMERNDAERVARKLHHAIGASTAPLSPHTFMGLLPNIAAARVAALFDLHGPNLVIDAGARSMLEVLTAANRWLARGTADVMLTSLLRLDVRQEPRVDEAALVLALTTPELANDRGWQVLAELVVGAHGEDKINVQPASGRSRANRPSLQLNVSTGSTLPGIEELAEALNRAAGGEATTVRWTGIADERGVPAPPHDTLVAGRSDGVIDQHGAEA